MQDTAVIIAAAGRSTRVAGLDKNFERLGGIPVLRRTLLAFDRAPSVGRLVVVTRSDRLEDVRAMLAGLSTPAIAVEGGADRQSSVRNGLRETEGFAYVAVHDGARPFVSVGLIERTIDAARRYGAAVPALPVTDTVKRAAPRGAVPGGAHMMGEAAAPDECVAETVDRAALRAVQTPQVFRRALYLRAVESCAGSYTDDSQLIERLGEEVVLVEGERSNQKLTTAEDFAAARLRLEPPRVGFGLDAHRLVEGRALILCGVRIPYEKGLLGHSDADAAAHALTDALLGAAALGDIGQHFPDTDSRYKDADSLVLLREAVRRIADAGYVPSNVDVTITAQRPKLAPYIPAMRENLAAALGLDVSAVSVKATTTERMGYEGRGEGISASAAAVLVPRQD